MSVHVTIPPRHDIPAELRLPLARLMRIRAAASEKCGVPTGCSDVLRAFFVLERCVGSCETE